MVFRCGSSLRVLMDLEWVLIHGFLWVVQQLHSDLRGNMRFFKSFPSLGGRRSRTTNDLGYFVGLSVYHFFFEPC